MGNSDWLPWLTFLLAAGAFLNTLGLRRSVEQAMKSARGAVFPVAQEAVDKLSALESEALETRNRVRDLASQMDEARTLLLEIRGVRDYGP